MVLSRDQKAGRNHTINIDNNSFESVEDFRYLVTTVMDQNSVHQDIKSGLKSEMLAIIRC